MSFRPSVINKGVGFYIPSLGEGGKGQAPTRSGGYAIRLNKRSQVSGARHPPSLGERLRVGELCSGMGPGVGVSYAPNGALICQPRATPGGRGCSMDNAPEGGKRIRTHTKGCGKGKLLFILLPLRGDTDV